MRQDGLVTDYYRYLHNTYILDVSNRVTHRIPYTLLARANSCLAMAAEASHTDVRTQPTAPCPFSARDLSLVRGHRLRVNGPRRTTDLIAKSPFRTAGHCVADGTAA